MSENTEEGNGNFPGAFFVVSIKKKRKEEEERSVLKKGGKGKEMAKNRGKGEGKEEEGGVEKALGFRRESSWNLLSG
jgi:hypothetical protein